MKKRLPRTQPEGRVVARAVTAAPGDGPSNGAKSGSKRKGTDGWKSPAAKTGPEGGGTSDKPGLAPKPKPKPAPKAKDRADDDKANKGTIAAVVDGEATTPGHTRPEPPAARAPTPITVPAKPAPPAVQPPPTPPRTGSAKVESQDKLERGHRFGKDLKASGRSSEEANLHLADNRRTLETTDEGPGRGNRGQEGGARKQGEGVDRGGEEFRHRRARAHANQRGPVTTRRSPVPPARGEKQGQKAAALAEKLSKEKGKGKGDRAEYKQLAGVRDLARSTSSPSARKRMLVITVNVLPVDAGTMMRRADTNREKAAAPPPETKAQK